MYLFVYNQSLHIYKLKSCDLIDCVGVGVGVGVGDGDNENDIEDIAESVDCKLI